MYNPALILELKRVRTKTPGTFYTKWPNPAGRQGSVPVVRVERFVPKVRSGSPLSDYMDASSAAEGGEQTATTAAGQTSSGSWLTNLFGTIGNTVSQVATIKSREIINRQQIASNLPMQPFFSNFTTPTGGLNFSTIAVVGALGLGAYLLLKSK